jgi:transposase
MKSISLAKINSMKELLPQSLSLQDIASKLDLSIGTVHKYKKKYLCSHENLKSGRKQLISESQKRLIKHMILKGEIKTAVEVHKYLVQEGYNLSYMTCNRILKGMGFKAQIKKKKPFLRNHHKIARYRWALNYQHWTVEDWKKVVWSDETKINIWGSDGVKYFWSRDGDPIQDHHLDLTVKHGGGSLMMWGCITHKGVGYGCHIEQVMDSQVYCEILEKHLKDSLDYHNISKENMIFQQDNDPKHTSKLAKKWFTDNGISVLPWPAQSPDLNPIEHLWHHLKIKLSSYEKRATSIGELWDRCDRIWNEFSSEICLKYYESMPGRIQAVLKAKGGHTRY